MGGFSGFTDGQTEEGGWAEICGMAGQDPLSAILDG